MNFNMVFQIYFQELYILDGLIVYSANDLVQENLSYDEDIGKESQNPTMIAVACTASIIITVVIFFIYVYKNQVQTNVRRVSNQVNRLSNNVAPHYAQYFQGPIQERISIVGS